MRTSYQTPVHPFMNFYIIYKKWVISMHITTEFLA